MRSVSYTLVTAQAPLFSRLSPVLTSPHFAAVIFIIASMAIGTTAGRAAGLLELLFGSAQPVQQVAAPPVQADMPRKASANTVHRKSKRALNTRYVRHKPKAIVTQSASSRAICVRLSDGYFFPSGRGGNMAEKQASCNIQCPNMETRLFLYPKGSDKIEDAKEANTGALYSAISAGFELTPLNKQAHGCHPITETASAASGMFNDPTLKRGDLIVTRKGIRMFKGRNHFPYDETDFAALQRAQGISKEKLAMLVAMERTVNIAR